MNRATQIALVRNIAHAVRARERLSRDQQVAYAKSLGQALRGHLDEMRSAIRTQPAPVVTNQVDVPSVEIVNKPDVPSVTNQVDMAPVAAALDRMTAAMVTQGAQIEAQNELLAQLLQVLADAPAPQFVDQRPLPLPEPRPLPSWVLTVGADGKKRIVPEERD